MNERHRQVLDSADIAKIVNTNDVLVRDLAGEHELALEAPFELGCRCARRRDVPA